MSGATPGFTGGYSCSSAGAESVDVCGCVVGRVGMLLARLLVCIGDREGNLLGGVARSGSGDSATAEPRRIGRGALRRM
jgi:hypothetical protein